MCEPYPFLDYKEAVPEWIRVKGQTYRRSSFTKPEIAIGMAEVETERRAFQRHRVAHLAIELNGYYALYEKHPLPEPVDFKLGAKKRGSRQTASRSAKRKGKRHG